MSIVTKDGSTAQTDNANVDIREQLFNEGRCGIVTDISTPICLITQVNGFLLDLDPVLFKPCGLIPNPALPPEELFDTTVSKWLVNHDVLSRAEVRISGTGFHVIIRPQGPLEFRSEEDRTRWDIVSSVIRKALPTDPHQPGLNALTRKVGSINSKTGAVVKCLRPGEGVPARAILDFAHEIATRPFRTIVQLLAGNDRITCPLCHDQKMVAMDLYGKCYCCGNVSIASLYHSMTAEKKAATVSAKEVRDAS